MPKYVTYKKIKQLYDIGPETIRNWAKKGYIEYKTIQNEHRKTWLYDIESIGNYVNNKDKKNKFVRILYARVSNKKQEEDLKRQIELLQNQFKNDEIISDIGSGLNYQRPGFRQLVARVCRGEIQQIVVTFKDRLIRFGFELFEQICEENGCKILVLSKELLLYDIDESEKETRELQEDLLSIVNVFVARRNGRRAGQLKKQRAQEKRNQEKIQKDAK